MIRSHGSQRPMGAALGVLAECIGCPIDGRVKVSV